MTRGQVGLLVIRARAEEGSARPLRATIRLTSDLASGFTEEVNVSDVDAATDLVRRWLNQVIGATE
jgi:DNA replicative helicase MCM subunit Mcm2 (Cdc46/Mcm family)